MRTWLIGFLLLSGMIGSSVINETQAEDYFTGTEDRVLSNLEGSSSSSPTLYFHYLKLDLMEMGSPLPHVGLGDIQDTGREQFVKNLKNYFRLNDLYNGLGDFNADFGSNLARYIKDGEVITGYQLHIVTKMISLYHHLSYRSLQFQSLYAPGHGPRSRDFINPQSPDQTLYNLIWLASHVQVMDRLIEAYNVYYKEEGKLRRILKSAYKLSDKTKKMSKELIEMAKHAVGKKNRKVMKKYAKLFKQELSTLKLMGETNEDIKKLTDIIASNPTIDRMVKGDKVKLKSYAFVDFFANVSSQVVDALSGFFGNIAGAVRWRKGYLIHHTAFHEELRKELKPLDIIYEKTPFALTDTFIPGYFGHAALWLGTEQELKDLGVWDHPTVAKYHDQIKQGYTIVESLRPGVSMNTLEGWMNIDSIAVMRYPGVLERDKVELGDLYDQALRHMGKDYDFNFDVTTIDKIVCSELVYHTFGDVRFPVKWRLGRPTIEPDNVAAVNFYDNSPFQFLTFVESEEKNKELVRTEIDLGDRLKFVVNEERSTPEDTAFDSVERKCRRVRVPRRTSRGRMRFKKKKVCTNERTPLIYQAPDVLHPRVPTLPQPN